MKFFLAISTNYELLCLLMAEEFRGGSSSYETDSRFARHDGQGSLLCLQVRLSAILKQPAVCTIFRTLTYLLT